jgi:hypothetical protein
MTYGDGERPAAAPAKDRGTLALILGIISVFVFGLVFGVPAIILGFRSPSIRGKIGGVLGIVGVVGWALLIYQRTTQ